MTTAAAFVHHSCIPFQPGRLELSQSLATTHGMLTIALCCLQPKRQTTFVAFGNAQELPWSCLYWRICSNLVSNDTSEWLFLSAYIPNNANIIQFFLNAWCRWCRPTLGGWFVVTVICSVPFLPLVADRLIFLNTFKWWNSQQHSLSHGLVCTRWIVHIVIATVAFSARPSWQNLAMLLWRCHEP